MDDFDLSRHEVVLACWYEGAAGAYRREWRSWTHAAGRALAGWVWLDVEAIEEPPSRPSRSAVGGEPEATSKSATECDDSQGRHKPQSVAADGPETRTGQ